MLRASRTQPELGHYRGRNSAATTQATGGSHRSDSGVAEPDNRIIFAVLAVGMLVGALLTTPAKSPSQAKAKTPATAVASSAAKGR